MQHIHVWIYLGWYESAATISKQEGGGACVLLTCDMNPEWSCSSEMD